MKKVYYSDQDIKTATMEIARSIWNDKWKPDYIVSLNRGGLIPGVMLSHLLSIRHHTLDVRLRDGDGADCESNCWMSEDAFGYDMDEVKAQPNSEESLKYFTSTAKNILIVDDINDEGNTLQWVVDDWKATCLPNHVRWNNVWHNNVRTAVICNNIASKFDVDYSAIEIDKAADPSWIVFPWEQWW